MATSSAGANLPPGLAVALAGPDWSAPAVLEVDEAYLGSVATAVAPRVVALLNLSRDQLDRVSEVRMVANRWRQALAGLETTVVANADDPLVVWAAGTAAQGDLGGGRAVVAERRRRLPVMRRADRLLGVGADGGWSCVCGFTRPQPDARLVGHELLTADGRRLPLDAAAPEPGQPGQRRHGRRGRRCPRGRRGRRPRRHGPGTRRRRPFRHRQPRRSGRAGCCWPRTRPGGPNCSTCSRAEPTRS